MREPVQYQLLSFSDDGPVRQFIFNKAGNPAGTPFTVLVEVGLARKLNVPLQDLPSLCARLLEARCEDEGSRTIRVTARHLSVIAEANAAAAQQLAKKRARFPSRGRAPEDVARQQADNTLSEVSR